MNVFRLELCSITYRAARTLVGVLPVVKAEVDHFMFPHGAERVPDFRFLLDLRAHESQQVHKRKLF